MGNCLNSSASGCINRPLEREKKANTVTKGDASDALPPWKRIPKEDNLHLFPGRIFSNDGRNRSASIFTQQGRKGINQDAMLLWDVMLLTVALLLYFCYVWRYFIVLV
jgi:hypothetical protein